MILKYNNMQNISKDRCLIHKDTNEVIVLSFCGKFIQFADGRTEPFEYKTDIICKNNKKCSCNINGECNLSFHIFCVHQSEINQYEPLHENITVSKKE
jgi:hypothetical protein